MSHTALVTLSQNTSGSHFVHMFRDLQNYMLVDYTSSAVSQSCLLDPLAFGVTQPSQPLTVFSGESGSTSSKAPLTLSPPTEIMRS